MKSYSPSLSIKLALLLQMTDNWVKYICKFDMLLEEAIRVCVKNSLQNMYEALHGDGTTGPNPILRLEANLKENRVLTNDFSFFSINCL